MVQRYGDGNLLPHHECDDWPVQAHERDVVAEAVVLSVPELVDHDVLGDPLLRGGWTGGDPLPHTVAGLVHPEVVFAEEHLTGKGRIRGKNFVTI